MLTGWTTRVEEGFPLPTARGSGIEEVTGGEALGGLAGVRSRGLSHALKTGGGGGGDTGLSTLTGLLRLVEFALDGLLLDPVIAVPMAVSDTAVDVALPITPGDLLCVLTCDVCCLLNLGGLEDWFFLFPI